MSEIILSRIDKNSHRTIGQFTYNNTVVWSLEDVDRSLSQTDDIAVIMRTKIAGKTAIPTGRYEVGLSYSNRFKKIMPILFNVPGFEGIRVHAGNTDADSSGCLLIGLNRSIDTITESRKANIAFMAWLTATLKKEKVFITIQ